MFNYKRRIILSFVTCGLLLICLQTANYLYYSSLSMHRFVSHIGVIEEESPEKIANIMQRIGSATPQDDELMYEKGRDILESLGYGINGSTYFESYLNNPTGFFLLITAILLSLTLLAIYTTRPVKKITTIIRELISNIDHAMNKLPVQLETTVTNIALVNELNTQITALVSQLNHQIDLLKRAQSDRTVFIENISHQVKTPLTCISLDLELLTNLKDREKISMYIDSCYTQIDHIEALMNRLLKIGKLESGKITYEFLEHNLLDTIMVLCNRLEDQYPDKHVTISYDEHEQFIINYDIVWLYEALENIIKNCYLYSYDNHGIEVSLVKYETYIKIVLRDHGIGISPADLPNIFDRFYRSEQTKNQEGFGIGLNLAKLVIEGHHGIIFAQSDNRSTQFIIHLPIIQS